MGRVAGLLYGLICYVIYALLVNIALLAVFALQHSGMARRGFKKVCTRCVPEPLERSTYVLFTSVALLLMFWCWEPIGGVVWEVDNPTAHAVLTALSLMVSMLVPLPPRNEPEPAPKRQRVTIG